MQIQKRIPSVSADTLKRSRAARTAGRWAWRLFRFALILGLSYVILYPLLFTLSSFLRAAEDNYNSSIIWIPRHYTLDNLKLALDLMSYDKTLLSTVIISVGCAVLQVCVSALVGYGFARFRFKFRNQLFALVLFTVIIPPSLLNLSLFAQYRNFDFFFLGYLAKPFTGSAFTVNLVDTYASMFLPSVLGVGLRGGLFIYIFRQVFKGMPDDLENAATIDGCGTMQAFLRIMLPCAGAAILVVFIFSFIWHWNDYYVTSTLLVDKMTLSPKLLAARSLVQYLDPIKTRASYPDYGSNEAILQAATFLVIFPPLFLYMFVQKYFIQSIERTGIVG